MHETCTTCTCTGDSVCSRKDKKQALKIIQRFHFSSSLKRMSVICAQHTHGSSDIRYIATVKGAAEVLQPMVSVPHLHYMCRILMSLVSLYCLIPPPPLRTTPNTLFDPTHSSRTFLSVTTVCTPVSPAKAFGCWHWDTSVLAPCCPVRCHKASM